MCAQRGSDAEDQTTMFLRRWHQGDPEALDQLLARHLEWISTHVRERLGPLLKEKAETGDYVAETVVEFLRYGPRFVLSNGRQFRGLLAKIAENVLRGKHRWWTAARRNIANERPLPSDTILELDPPQESQTSPSQAAVRGEREAFMRLGLELLEQDQREVIVLRNYEDLRFSEIAERIGTTTNTAQKRYERALDAFSRTVGALRRGDVADLLGQEADGQEAGA